MAKTNVKRILVPFDGSKFSQNAVNYAVDLASKYNAKVTFVTVVPSNSNPSPTKALGIFVSDKKMLKGFHDAVCTIRVNLKGDLEELVEFSKKNDVSANYMILDGNPVEKIVQFAKKEKFDRIVLASHGLTGLTKLQALGSVARAISEISPCPVLLIRD